MKLCGDLKSKVRDLETSLSAREDDVKTLQQVYIVTLFESSNLIGLFSHVI